jgi:hypothetical protein
MARTHTHTHVNGKRVDGWAPRMALASAPPLPASDGPQCPKHCDSATPLEVLGSDRYVCVCCGMEFTWRPS